MKHNLDRVIRFEAVPKFKNLYPWALQEVAEDGEAGRDQIPWTLSHSFTATELTLHESNAAKSEYETSRTWIRAKLTPGKGRRYRPPTYSMFGTDRTIDQIQLFIHRIEDDAEEPENAVWASGFPSYTSDDPLWGGTEPDCLQFDLNLTRAEFERIADRAAANQIDAAIFRCHAHGFYSEWTPDIETSAFKVLCAERKEQQVEVPEGCETELPRIGEVWDATFSIQRIVQPSLFIEQLRREAAQDDDDAGNDWGAPTLSDEPDPRWVKPLLAELKTVKVLIGAIGAVLVLGFLLK